MSYVMIYRTHAYAYSSVICQQVYFKLNVNRSRNKFKLSCIEPHLICVNEKPSTRYTYNMLLHCMVKNCNVTQANKTPGIYLHPCPKSVPMRKQWLTLLQDKCDNIDWKTSRICSKHFEMKYLDSSRKLKDNAIPTIFNNNKNLKNAAALRLVFQIGKLSQKQLHQNIQDSLQGLEEPSDIQDYVNDDLEMSPTAPIETQLWFIVKKQNHLIKALMDSALMYKNYATNARNKLELTRANTKEHDKSLETQKYLVKCLQERQATLEEQIEIITAVESRK